ncbi:hypothetical protein G7Z17_g5183 [Cylindrodendrum hubeiense]|uniref:Rhodopsin domain-containing protein n=1 Tax=Cylindrodendrum hubeiense TaxID=595255 RepID=A0A9P5LGF8_9HYPO|nr:hypothetical protein G7Z17_g5183 [Cylindrodendrum hubeiense]
MSSFTTEAFTLLGIGLGILGLRVYARIHAVGVRNLEWDDHFMLLAALLYSAETALAYSVGAYWHGLANNAMTDAAREALDSSSQEYTLRVNGSKTQIAGWTVYITLLWTLKAAMCAFYLRLTEGLGNYRPRISAGFVLILVTWIAVLLSILFGCHPLHKYWQINPDPGNLCQPAVSKINLFVTLVLNGVTDFYLLSIPVPMLWDAEMCLDLDKSGKGRRTGGLLGSARDICGSSDNKHARRIPFHPKTVVSDPWIAFINSTIRRRNEQAGSQSDAGINTIRGHADGKRKRREQWGVQEEGSVDLAVSDWPR